MYNAPYLCTRGLVLTGNDGRSLPVNFVILGLVLQVKDMHFPVVVCFCLENEKINSDHKETETKVR
jgi:hypothetical protein